MRDTIKKWWNRTWSNWEEFEGQYQNYSTPDGLATYLSFIKLKRTSNDGLIEFKKIKIT